MVQASNTNNMNPNAAPQQQSQQGGGAAPTAAPAIMPAVAPHHQAHLMGFMSSNPALAAAAAAAASSLFPPTAMLSNQALSQACLSSAPAPAGTGAPNTTSGTTGIPQQQQQQQQQLAGSVPLNMMGMPQMAAIPTFQPQQNSGSGNTPIAPLQAPFPLMAPFQPVAPRSMPFQPSHTTAGTKRKGDPLPPSGAKKPTVAQTDLLTKEERSKQNRERNREHARSTRLRKKAYVQKLKELVEGLHAERSEEARQRRVAIQHLAEMQNVRRAVVRTALRYHSAYETDERKWTTLLEDSFWLKQPVSPYRSFRRAEIEKVRL
jgi:hypothetical protein